ncbi:hypothetical protein DASC09_012320 [Saccharomycopsis crataegensis]|uniref:Protein-tyrosine-phosphatase n=1 Tax=Saccharomycopsis crataegensis TaxID=43959 RepID=A0AAV5QH01_9ASCO|nr:hypothetical protein DASC09_012320 [Saccharomycopsis crataegensis]
MLIYDNSDERILYDTTFPGFSPFGHPVMIAPTTPITTIPTYEPPIPTQFSPSVYLGNTNVLSNPEFFNLHRDIKVIITCMSSTKINGYFLKNRNSQFNPPDYCVLNIDPTFKGANHHVFSDPKSKTNSQILKFISKYGSTLNAMLASNSNNSQSIDITSPMIIMKDKPSLVEDIVNFMTIVQDSFPSAGILIVYDDDSERDQRYSILLSVAYIISKNHHLNVLDAMLLLKSYTSIVDELSLNQRNFFNVLNEYRLKIVASNRFHHSDGRHAHKRSSSKRTSHFLNNPPPEKRVKEEI